MFAGFEVDLDSVQSLPGIDNCYNTGKQIYEGHESKAKEVLEKYLTQREGSNGSKIREGYVRSLVNNFLNNVQDDDEFSLSAAKLEKDWFPKFNADVFLSHSHDDEDLAIKLAGWLNENFQITTFIDSCIWGYCKDLMRILDDGYSKKRTDVNGITTYDYDDSSYAASHVHMLLNNALAKMIDETECLIFLNTPNSITPEESVKKRTKSPWLYSELTISQIIRHQELSVYRKNIQTKAVEKSYSLQESLLSILYTTSTEHLYKLSNLRSWYDWCKRDKTKKPSNWQSLDKLYEIEEIKSVPINE